MKTKFLSTLTIVTGLLLMGCIPITSSSSSSVSSSSSSSSSVISSSSEVLETFTMTFNTNGGSLINPIEVLEGQTITVPTPPTKTGYTFDGWYEDVLFTTLFIFDVMPSHNVTLYAKWLVNTYTISFNTNGGTAIPSITLDFGEDVNEPIPPTKTGHSFLGWYSDIGLTTLYTFTTMPAMNMTLYAKWSVNIYTITFDSNGGSAITPIGFDFGVVITAPNPPTKEGFLFDGWFSDIALLEPYVFTTMPAENITLYAKWIVDIYAGAITIAQFNALPLEDTNAYDVVGVMIMDTLDGGAPALIADETGVLVVMNPSILLKRGDLVRYHGVHTVFENVPVMDNGSTHPEWVTVYDHEQVIPYSPIPMSVSDFLLLEPNTSSNWMTFNAIEGLLTVDHETHRVTLTEGESSMNVFPMGMEDYELLSLYQNLRVTVHGVVFPNFDEEPPFLMFIFNGDPLTLAYESDAALLLALETMFLGYFETMTYAPGDEVELPTEHPIIPVTLTYEATGVNANAINLETHLIDETLTINVDIEVIVTMTLDSLATHTFMYVIHVVIPVITPLDAFSLLPDFNPELGMNNPVYDVQGVVLSIMHQEESMIVVIADATGVAFILTNDLTIVVADEILAKGYKMSQGDMPFLYGDPSQTIRRVLSQGNSMPMNVTPITLAAFASLSPANPGVMYTYYEMTGTLIQLSPESPHVFGLTDGTTTVIIFASDEPSMQALLPYVNEFITLRGLSIIGGDPGTEAVFLAYFALPQTLLTNPT